MKQMCISCDEFDRLSDFQARNYVYCHDCNMYHIKGSECPCGLSRQIEIITNDK